VVLAAVMAVIMVVPEVTIVETATMLEVVVDTTSVPAIMMAILVTVIPVLLAAVTGTLVAI